MDADLIIISEYCHKSHIEPSFVISLEKGGLIEIQTVEGEQYIPVSQLSDLERYSHLYYDLAINVEGIDAIRHILNRMQALQQEIRYLRTRLERFQPDLYEEYDE